MNSIFWGLLLAVLNFSFKINALVVFTTSFIGYIILYNAAPSLTIYSEKFARIRKPALIGIIASSVVPIIGIITASSIFTPLMSIYAVLFAVYGVVSSLAEIVRIFIFAYISYTVIDAVCDSPVYPRIIEDTKNGKASWVVMILCQLASIVSEAVGFSDLSVLFVIVASIAVVFLHINIWRFKKAFERI